MSTVSISAPFFKRVVAVEFAGRLDGANCQAILLGHSGERLKTYSLTESCSELSLEGFGAGSYTLQIISGAEILAQQIIIP